MKIIPHNAPGQKPLLEGPPPCDCPTERLTDIQMRMMHPIAEMVERTFNDCPIGVATVLGLMAANLVNPANVTPESRAEARRCSLIVAETFEKIAKGIRARALQ